MAHSEEQLYLLADLLNAKVHEHRDTGKIEGTATVRYEAGDLKWAVKLEIAMVWTSLSGGLLVLLKGPGQLHVAVLMTTETVSVLVVPAGKWSGGLQAVWASMVDRGVKLAVTKRSTCRREGWKRAQVLDVRGGGGDHGDARQDPQGDAAADTGA